ncbi:unnamed protein product [Rotaria sp. Silwood1]|nr:unnamed protein product [Rotaria sp. Silwood1]CAF1522538.1 unnamed protein product [Rotaria sp. Silwood1]
MLCPWMFFSGYMKLYPRRGCPVTVTVFAPILANLGRLPFADSLPPENHALLRIQQNLVRITGYALIEPSCWWLNNEFSNSRYKTLVQHQIDICTGYPKKMYIL